MSSDSESNCGTIKIGSESFVSVESVCSQYVVERIVDKRIHLGRTEYLIKWAGYSDSENTWEPKDNVLCKDLLAEFEESHKKKFEKQIEKNRIEKINKALEFTKREEIKCQNKQKQQEVVTSDNSNSSDANDKKELKENKKKLISSMSNKTDGTGGMSSKVISSGKKKIIPVQGQFKKKVEGSQPKFSGNLGKNLNDIKKSRPVTLVQSVSKYGKLDNLGSTPLKSKTDNKGPINIGGKECKKPEADLFKPPEGRRPLNKTVVQKLINLRIAALNKPDTVVAMDMSIVQYFHTFPMAFHGIRKALVKLDSQYMDEITGFDRNLEVESIIGITKASDEPKFLIKWRGLDSPELIPTRIVNRRAPQKVIKFYEERVLWASGSDDSEDDFPSDTSAHSIEEVTL